MNSPSEHPSDDPGRGDQNDLGYRNAAEERAYDEAGEQSSPGEDPERGDADDAETP